MWATFNSHFRCSFDEIPYNIPLAICKPLIVSWYWLQGLLGEEPELGSGIGFGGSATSVYDTALSTSVVSLSGAVRLPVLAYFCTFSRYLSIPLSWYVSFTPTNTPSLFAARAVKKILFKIELICTPYAESCVAVLNEVSSHLYLCMCVFGPSLYV